MLTTLLIAAAVGYLLGALPFGYLVARAKGVNIFEVGSKNPGATNVRRVLGHGPGNLVLFLDALKGALAVGWPPVVHRLAGERCPFDGSQIEILAIVGLVAAILGHSFSCFTGFRGGKSVATGAGGFLVLFPAGMGIGFVIFALIVATTRYVSLGSMTAALALPVAAVAFGRSSLLIGVSAAIAVFVIVRHRSNVARLLAGTETKVGRASAPKS
jgi:glycerol-3-phosphate acyltransferase PlsY